MLNIKKIINCGINFDVIKIIALITMVIDHIGHILYPYNPDLRIIGRTTFPLFSFLIAYHLSQKDLFKKYILRLLPFAILSTLLIAPFEVLIKGYFRLNIFWSFLVAIAPLFIIKKTKNFKKYLRIFITTLGFILFASISFLCDYKLCGFLLTIFFYAYFKTKKIVFIPFLILTALILNSDHLLLYPKIILSFMAATVLPVLLILWQSKYISLNQKRFLKPWWIFYLFYPVHFLVLYLIKLIYF